MKCLFILFSLCLFSCAGLQQSSFDRVFAEAIIRNNTYAVFGNCNSRNAVSPLNGVPPLYYAASYGNEDVIDLLYSHGASLQARSHEGKSLVYAAAANGHVQTAQKLLALNAGTAGDLRIGAAEYQQKRVAESEAQKLQSAAITWLVGAIASGSDPSSFKDSYEGTRPISNAEYQRFQLEPGGTGSRPFLAD